MLAEYLSPVPAMTAQNVVAPNTTAQFQPRYIGPQGNRVSAIAGVVGDPLIYYAGAAAGGIFKTTDGGTHWTPVFDGQAAAVGKAARPERVASIGAIAVSESHPDVVWAGTGESWIRTPISIGNGVYKSADAGQTWTRMGLPKSGRIAKIVIHPTDPNTVWVAALGSCYDDPEQQRGLYVTTDGGLNWTLSLFVDSNTGCCDIAVDATNPNVVYAGMWQFAMRSWIRVSGGPGSGIYKSTDAGSTWRELTKGLPSADVGKISVGVARSNPNFVYANIETGDGVATAEFPDPAHGQLWRSADAGESWTLQSYNRWVNSRPAYYTRNAVSPDNHDEVYFFGPQWLVTQDGGETMLPVLGYPNSPGYDHHEAWIDPTNGDRITVAHDGGVAISQDRGVHWYKIQLPIAQVYQVNVDREIPYNVFGNVQDLVGTWGPSNARIGYNGAEGDASPGPIPRGSWTFAGGGESGYTIPDPTDPDLIWTSGSSDGSNGGIVALVNRRTGHLRNVSISNEFTTGTAPVDVELRFHWHMPLAISPHDRGSSPDDPRLVYAGSQYVHATINRGNSWRRISPELTGSDPRYLQSSGGLTADNLGNRMAYTISAITESPIEPGLMWVGTNDQRIWIGREQNAETWQWTSVQADIPGLPFSDDPDAAPWGTVSRIAPSRHEAGVAYVCFDFHQAADSNPYIYKVTDYGATWKLITDGISPSVVSYVHWIAEDPVCPGLLFVGTENALYVSFDDGGSWQELPGLPPTPVSGMVVEEHFHDLVLSTFGRGFWIFDDITPLRQLADIGASAVHLFEMPRPMYRFQQIAQPGATENDNDPTIGIDPPSPAPINFYLSSPSDDVTITIFDEAGDAIRTIDGLIGNTGINRVWWDLQSDPTEMIRLRTNPSDQMALEYCGPILDADGLLSTLHIRPYNNAIGGTSLSWLVPPGRYRVELAVDDGMPLSQFVDVVMDPTSVPTPVDVSVQHDLSQQIWSTLDDVCKDINQCEWIRFQLEHVIVPDFDSTALESIDAIKRALFRIEGELVQMNIIGQGEDLARFPARLVVNLAQLGANVAMGDFPPTDSQYEQSEKLQAKFSDVHTSLQQQLIVVDELNARLGQHGLAPLGTTSPNEPLGEPCRQLFAAGAAF